MWDLFLVFYISERDIPFCATDSPQNPVIRFFRAIEHTAQRVLQFYVCDPWRVSGINKLQANGYKVTDIGPTILFFLLVREIFRNISECEFRSDINPQKRRAEDTSVYSPRIGMFSLSMQELAPQVGSALYKHSKAKVDVLFRPSSRRKTNDTHAG